MRTYAAAALRTTMKCSVRGEPTDEALRAMRIAWGVNMPMPCSRTAAALSREDVHNAIDEGHPVLTREASRYALGDRKFPSAHLTRQGANTANRRGDWSAFAELPYQ